MSPQRRSPRRLPARAGTWKRTHPASRMGGRIPRPRYYVEHVDPDEPGVPSQRLAGEAVDDSWGPVDEPVALLRPDQTDQPEEAGVRPDQAEDQPDAAEDQPEEAGEAAEAAVVEQPAETPLRHEQDEDETDVVGFEQAEPDEQTDAALGGDADQPDEDQPDEDQPDGEQYPDAYASAYARAFTSSESGAAYHHAYTRAVRDERDGGRQEGRHDGRQDLRQERAERPRRGRRLVLIAAVVLVVAAIAATVVLNLGSSPSAAPDRPVAGNAADARVFASLPRDGSLTRTRVLADGDLQVDQWIRSRAPLSALTLAPPNVPGLDAGKVVARNVVVRAGTTRGTGAGEVSGAPARYTLDDAHAVRISYLLTGVVEISSSTTGRALARVAGLDVDYASARGPRTVTVVGRSVLALACLAEQPGAMPQACGRPAPGAGSGSRSAAWTVSLDSDQAVMAQVELR